MKALIMNYGQRFEEDLGCCRVSRLVCRCDQCKRTATPLPLAFVFHAIPGQFLHQFGEIIGPFHSLEVIQGRENIERTSPRKAVCKKA